VEQLEWSKNNFYSIIIQQNTQVEQLKQNNLSGAIQAEQEIFLLDYNPIKYSSRTTQAEQLEQNNSSRARTIFIAF
jgi:hypothetical protein